MVVINSYQLNTVEHFTYQESMISNDTSIKKDIENRLTKANSSFGLLHKHVLQNHSLSQITKNQVYRAIVISTLLYSRGPYIKDTLVYLGSSTNAASDASWE